MVGDEYKKKLRNSRREYAPDISSSTFLYSKPYTRGLMQKVELDLERSSNSRLIEFPTEFQWAFNQGIK